MTKDQALTLLRVYAEHLRGVKWPVATAAEIDMRWPADGSTHKAMRWLGFMQGYLVAHDLFTLDEVKDHSRLISEGKFTTLARRFPCQHRTACEDPGCPHYSRCDECKGSAP